MVTKRKANKKKVENKAVVLSREAPTERSMSASDLAVKNIMTAAQYVVLTAKTPAHAIRTRPGGKAGLLKYVPHGYVTDMLNKAFGFDWDYKLLPVFNGSIFHQVDIRTGKDRLGNDIIAHYISVYGELTVKIHDPKHPENIVAEITKPGPGSSVWYVENEWGDALKSAKSDGLKVAAHELGIALDLYYDDDAALQQYEDKQAKERRRQEEQDHADFLEGVEISKSIDEIAEEIKPITGIQLISRASAMGYSIPQVENITGVSFAEMQGSYQSSYWDKLIEHHNKENGNGNQNTGKGKNRSK